MTGNSGDFFTRWSRPAGIAGYIGLYSLLGLVFASFLLDGAMAPWGQILLRVAIGLALAAMVCGAVINYRRLGEMLGSRRGKAGMSVALAVAAGIVILVGVNYISYRRYVSWDVTSDSRFTLSEQTRKQVERVESGERELHIVSFLPHQLIAGQAAGIPMNARAQVAELLGLYDDLSRKVHVQHMEIESQRVAATHRARALGLSDIPQDTVVVQYGERIRRVPITELYRLQQRTFQGRPEPAIFRGEDAITSAVRNLVDERQKKVYFLTGHGEREVKPGPENVSLAAEGLKDLNFDVGSLDLATEGSVPEDADCLVVVGPRKRMPAATIEAIEGYLERGGSLLYMADAIVTGGAEAPSGLERALADYGIKIHQDAVGVGPELKQASMTMGLPVASSQIMRPFEGGRAWMVKPAVLEVTPPRNSAFNSFNILEGSDGSWGERKPDSQLRMDRMKFDEGEDVAGPTVLGAAAEPYDDSLGFGRVVVFSDVDWVANQFMENPAIRRAAYNMEIFLASISWMTGRIENIGIPPKEMDIRVANVEAGKRTRLFFGIVVLPAGIMVAMGIAVWRARSR